MWKKIKAWWIKRKIRKALKNTVFQPPIKRTAGAIILDEFDELGPPCADKKVEEQRQKWLKYLKGPAPAFNHPESELPQFCPQCNTAVTPSRIDDRVVGCRRCNMMFVTKEAHDDPNIQRDITHANAGITPKQTKMSPRDRIIAHEGIMDVLWIKREIELDQARAFGEGYTRGKHGMSRAKYNEKMKQERENLENENA